MAPASLTRPSELQLSDYNPALHTITNELQPVCPTEQLSFPMIVHGMDLEETEEQLGIDLGQLLAGRPDSTFVSHARDDQLSDQGIYRGDMLIIDRALRPQNNDLVLACINGELLGRMLDLDRGLLIGNPDEASPITISEQDELMIIGVITHCIRSFR